MLVDAKWSGTHDLIYCSYLMAFLIGRLPTIQQEVQQRKLLYMGLYLLIWGEASNLRFMPECLCYIYHHVCTVQIVPEIAMREKRISFSFSFL